MDMTIRQILTLLQSEYPQSFSGMDARTMALKVELWEREFANDNLNLVYAAIRTYMRTPARFAPSIGQVREIMTGLTKEEALPEQAAWAMVSKACQNGIYGYEREFEKLPPDIQTAVGAPEQLKAWASMDADTVESVVASNFMRNYRASREREKARAALPTELRNLVDGMADTMKLGGSGGGFKREILGEPPKPAALPEMIRDKPVEVKKYEPTMINRKDLEPLSDDEWQKRRDAMIQKLAEYGRGENA